MKGLDKSPDFCDVRNPLDPDQKCRFAIGDLFCFNLVFDSTVGRGEDLTQLFINSGLFPMVLV